MKLKITEEFWYIDRRNPQKSGVKKTDVKVFDCVAGNLPEFEHGQRNFSIDAVTENSVTLTVHYKDEKYNKTWTIKKGEGVFYRPRSFDGGYQYSIKVK